MFGRMSATPLVRLDAGKELEIAVAELLAATDYPEIARWIQFPRGLMLFLLVPGDRSRSQKSEVRSRAQIKQPEVKSQESEGGTGRHNRQPGIDGGAACRRLFSLVRQPEGVHGAISASPSGKWPALLLPAHR